MPKKTLKTYNYIDLFAGAGGLSEGFVRAGYNPVAHVEIDKAACYTLRTRLAYHWLKKQNRLNEYNSYLDGDIDRDSFYNLIPEEISYSVINTEITENTLDSIFHDLDKQLCNKPVDLIIGGPPCQAYSVVGRSRDKDKMQNDKRNFLYVYYAKFLERYQPKFFVFENVKGLLSAKSPEGVSYFESMRNVFRDIGYETEYQVLSTEKYGVLQNRKRVIIIGHRGNKKGFFPKLDTWSPGVTVNEILQDLPALQAGEGCIKPCSLSDYKGEYLYNASIRNDNAPVTFHIARPHTVQDKKIYKIAVEKWNNNRERLQYNDLPQDLQTHNNKSSFTDRFKVVAGDLPWSHTVVAHISKDGHYYIHPDNKQNRSLTPREAARIQTFPDDFYFESMTGKPARTTAYKQIGNAVPVLFAEQIAKGLLKEWG